MTTETRAPTVTTRSLRSLRLRQARMIAPFTARALEPAGIATGIGLAVVVLGYELRRVPDPGSMMNALRLAMLFLACSIAFALDDPAAATTESVATPRWFRRALRIAVAAAPVACAWGMFAVIGAARAPGVPAAALTLELVALCAVALGVASIARGIGAVAAGAAAFPVLLAFHVLSRFLPPRWTLTGGFPGEPVWADAHRRWAFVLAAALALILRTSRDPAHRR